MPHFQPMPQLQLCWIFNPLCQARDQSTNTAETSQIINPLDHSRNSNGKESEALHPKHSIMKQFFFMLKKKIPAFFRTARFPPYQSTWSSWALCDLLWKCSQIPFWSIWWESTPRSHSLVTPEIVKGRGRGQRPQWRTSPPSFPLFSSRILLVLATPQNYYSRVGNMETKKNMMNSKLTYWATTSKIADETSAICCVSQNPLTGGYL